MEQRDYQDVDVGNDEDVQQVSFHRIEELENYGISKPDISKLKHGGYHTIESVKEVDINKALFNIVFLMITS